MGQVSSLRVLE